MSHEERRQRHADEISRQHGLALTEIGETAKHEQHKEKKLDLRLARPPADPLEQPGNDPRQHRDNGNRDDGE